MQSYLTAGGGVKRVKEEGGNSGLAMRLAKGNRYGNETYKQRFPTHVRFCMRLLTYTTKQTAVNTQGGIPAVPVTNTVATPGYNLRPEGDVRLYRNLNPRTTTGSNGTMSLNALGLFWCWAEELPTVDCPWLHTYFAYKLDAAGFNLCDPQQFSEGCSRFNKVKQGPSCATFVFPDVPIDKAGPVRRYYPLLPSTQLPGGGGTPIIGSAYAPANVEERGIGAWEMIIISPRKKKSVWIENCVSQSGWDSLIDMGFKPRPAKRVTKIYCSNSGIDVADTPSMYSILNQTIVRARNTAPNYQSIQVPFNLSDLTGKKLTYLDTEDCCQYTPLADPGQDTIVEQVYPSVTAAAPGLQMFSNQGYPCVPFGSAVIFRFRQYAPLQTTYNPDGTVSAYVQTCVRQTIPLDLYLDSVTTFKEPIKGSFDLDLAFTNPALKAS